MLENKKPLLYVQAIRNTGVSKKTGNEYDMAILEVSDGIASLELPIEPNLASHIMTQFDRGNPVSITVDIQKRFGRANFIVTNVVAAGK